MSSALVSQSQFGSSFGVSMGNNQLKRKSTRKPPFLARNKRAGVAAPRVPPSLRRYLSLRGTPDGTYEINRHVAFSFDVLGTGIPIGAGNYEAATFTISPGAINLVSGIAGNTSTFNIPNSAELAALWDKVKIDKVLFTFTCVTQGPVPGNYATGQPLLYFAEDDNDTNASLAQIQQMECSVWQPTANTSTYKIQIKPKYQRLVFYTAVVSSYEPTRGYVVSGTEIPHYGLKVGAYLNGGAAGMRINVDAQVFYKLKELK